MDLGANYTDRVYPPQYRDNDITFFEICPHTLRSKCRDVQGDPAIAPTCEMTHFEIRRLPQTDTSLGDCSYLNACHRLDSCRYIHYELETPSRAKADKMAAERRKKRSVASSKEAPGQLLPPQWLDADLRKLDASVLGKFDVIMADPPWDSTCTRRFWAADVAEIF